MLGCAMLAAVASGLFPTISDAADAMVSVDRVIRPNPEVHQQYEQHYQRYIGLYPALRPTFHVDVRTAFQEKGRSAESPQQQHFPTLSPSAPPSSHHQPPSDASIAPKGTQRLKGIVSASILAADVTRLGSETISALSAGADWVHADMFDGSFVKNFTFGPPVLKALSRAAASLGGGAFFDCHLSVAVSRERDELIADITPPSLYFDTLLLPRTHPMCLSLYPGLHTSINHTQDPAQYVADVADAGGSQFTFHAEALGCDTERMLALAAEVRKTGMRYGVEQG